MRMKLIEDNYRDDVGYATMKMDRTTEEPKKNDR